MLWIEHKRLCLDLKNEIDNKNYFRIDKFLEVIRNIKDIWEVSQEEKDCINICWIVGENTLDTNRNKSLEILKIIAELKIGHDITNHDVYQARELLNNLIDTNYEVETEENDLPKWKELIIKSKMLFDELGDVNKQVQKGILKEIESLLEESNEIKVLDKKNQLFLKRVKKQIGNM